MRSSEISEDAIVVIDTKKLVCGLKVRIRSVN